jgi:hypothetical protein
LRLQVPATVSVQAESVTDLIVRELNGNSLAFGTVTAI